MSEDLFGRSINERIQAELRENEAPYEDKYIEALAYFGLNRYATEDDVKRVYRTKVSQYHTDTGNTSNEIGSINAKHDIIKKHFKHIKWENSVRDKKIEIQTLMKNDITFSNIDSSLAALNSKLNSIYNTYFRRVEYESTLAGLEHLYSQYKNALRQEYKNVLMHYGYIELDPSIKTLQEFNNFLINLLNKNKFAFLEELDNEYHKYQNDESYRPLLKIIINLIDESKDQVQSSSFINERIKEEILTNLRTRINKLQKNYLDIEGTLKYLQEFFAEIENHELGTKSKSLLDRLNNLQSEEELNQINNEVEPLKKEAKEYERKKEQEEIDNYIKGLISKYNSLIQNASLEELQELTTKLGKICELISKGKSLNKNLAYYQNLEIVLEKEELEAKKMGEPILEETAQPKLEISPSGIYIRKDNYKTLFCLFHRDINKFELIHSDGISSSSEFCDITQEELERDYISLDEYCKNSMEKYMFDLKDYGNLLLEYKNIIINLEFSNNELIAIRKVSVKFWESYKEGEKYYYSNNTIIDMIKKFIVGKSLRDDKHKVGHRL